MGVTIQNNFAPGSGAPGPLDYGYDAWSFEPWAATANQGLTTQQVLAIRCPVPKTFSLTQVWYPLAVVGATFTYARVGVYDSAGTTLLATSDDQTSNWSSGLVAKAATFTATTIPGGPGASVWVAFLAVATTPPTFLRQVAGSGPYATMVNNGTMRAGTMNSQTSLPAALSLTAGAGLLWVGLT